MFNIFADLVAKRTAYRLLPFDASKYQVGTVIYLQPFGRHRLVLITNEGNEEQYDLPAEFGDYYETLEGTVIDLSKVNFIQPLDGPIIEAIIINK